jgi:hypothetical protein
MHGVDVEVDFGPAAGPETNLATVVVTGVQWITLDTNIMAIPTGSTADHDPDDYAVERINVTVSDQAPGTVTLKATAQNGSWGRYKIRLMGAW